MSARSLLGVCSECAKNVPGVTMTLFVLAHVDRCSLFIIYCAVIVN